MNTTDLATALDSLLDRVLADGREAAALCERMGTATVGEARSLLRAQVDAMQEAVRLQKARTDAVVQLIGAYPRAQASALLDALSTRQRAMVDLSWDGDHAEQLAAELALANDVEPRLEALKARLRELDGSDTTDVRH